MTPVQLKAKYIKTSDNPSIWLSSLPLKIGKCSLTKHEFFDAVFLRYGWAFKNLTHKCVCTAKYNISHVIKAKLEDLSHFAIMKLYTSPDMLSMVCKDAWNQN